MSRLAARFPSFSDVFDGNKMRAFIAQIENLFARINIDETLPAYSVATNTTLGAADEVVLVDTSGGNVEITLPEISDSMIRTKREFEVVKIEAANRLTITPTGTDTILGEPDAQVYAQWTALRFRAATANWVVI